MSLASKIVTGIIATWVTLLCAILIFLVSTIFSNCAHGDVFELDSVNVDYIHMFTGGVDPLVTENSNLPHRTIGNRIELNVDTRILSYLYWNNRIHSTTDENIDPDNSTNGGQFRAIGLEFHLGVNLTDYMQFGYYHHSQHILDAEYSAGPFPREDGLELKLILFKNKSRPDSLF